MKRFHDEIFIMKKRSKLNHKYGGFKSALGYFRKRRPLDCGIPQCPICHGSKLIGDKRHSERKQLDRLDYNEDMA
jgi:hypothetical protein